MTAPRQDVDDARRLRIALRASQARHVIRCRSVMMRKACVRWHAREDAYGYVTLSRLRPIYQLQDSIMSSAFDVTAMSVYQRRVR